MDREYSTHPPARRGDVRGGTLRTENLPAGTSIPGALLAALAATTVLGNLSVNSGPVLLGAAIDGLALDSQTAGLFLSLEYGAFALASLFVARRIDRLPRRRTALGAGGVLVLAHLAAAAAASFPALASARMLAGACAGALVSTANAVVAGTRDPERVFAQCLAATVLVVTLVLTAMPTFSVPHAHHGAYGLLVAISLLILPLLRGLPRGANPRRTESAMYGRIGPTGVLLLAAALLVAFSDQVVFSFAERIGLAIGLPAQTVASGLGVSYLGGLAGALLAVRVDLRFGRTAPIAIGIAMSAGAGLAIALSGSSIMYFAAVSAKNFSFFFLVPYLLGTAAALDPGGRLAAASAGPFLLGLGLGPLLAGGIVGAWGYAALGWVGAGAATLSLLGFMRVLRALSAAGSPDGEPGAAFATELSEKG